MKTENTNVQCLVLEEIEMEEKDFGEISQGKCAYAHQIDSE